MVLCRGRAHHGFQRLLILLDAHLHVFEHLELLLEQQSGGSGKFQLLQKAQANFAEEIAAHG